MKFRFNFEPKKPITNPREFTDELISYCKKENKDLTILHEGMEPIVSINGEEYICMLENPKLVSMPILSLFASNTYGFKWVYIYSRE